MLTLGYQGKVKFSSLLISKIIIISIIEKLRLEKRGRKHGLECGPYLESVPKRSLTPFRGCVFDFGFYIKMCISSLLVFLSLHHITVWPLFSSLQEY